MKKHLLFATLSLSLLFVSCRKDIESPTNQPPSNMEEIVVPANFNWKTTKEYKLSVTAPSMGIVEVNSAQGATYQKAYLQAAQAYTMQLTLPAYEKSVKLKFGNQTATLELNAAVLSYNFQ